MENGHRTDDAIVYVSRDLDRRTIEKAYSGWAPIYDGICGPVLRHGRVAASRAVVKSRGRILEVGVGTGLSFYDYAGTGTSVVGIDLNPQMLAKARARLKDGRFPEIETVEEMDAHDLRFEAGSFDAAVCPFVITLVENPEQVLSECARVVRPGGDIIIVSHLYSEKGVAAFLERQLASRIRAIGLRPEFPFARLMRWAEARGNIALIERRPVRPFYTLVRFRVNGPAERDAASAASAVAAMLPSDPAAVIQLTSDR